MKPIILISTTFESKADAERIAELLLDRKLIACAQISAPMTSLYRWKGVTTSAIEYALNLKTVPQCTEEIKVFIRKEHPYDLPEIIIQEIGDSSNEYSEWIYGEVIPCP
ncbi:MAG: divalent-cation tolerance protein CutA [Desulforhopalus sp.]